MRLILILIATFFLSKCIIAQDANFTQFYAANSYYNPAFAGAFDGKYRLRLINRDQWLGEQFKSLRTFSISGDIKFALRSLDLATDFFGIGLYFINDKVRSLDFNTNEASLTLSYHKILDKKKSNYISSGFSFGINQRGLNYDLFTFEDQFNGIDQYNGTSKEILPPNIRASGDLKLGVQYNTRLNSNYRLQTGISSHYTLIPNRSYYQALDDRDYLGSKSDPSDIKLNLIANFTYDISSLRQLYPRLLYSFQGAHQIAIIGTNYRHGFYNLKQTAIHTGASLRIAKNEKLYKPIDLSLLAGFEINNFVIGLSYDFGLRDVFAYNRPSHSIELSLTLIGDYDDGGFICPKF